MQKKKTVTLTNKQIDILEDLLLATLEDETNNNSLSRDEEYINDLKEIYNEIVSNRFDSERYVNFESWNNKKLQD